MLAGEKGKQCFDLLKGRITLCLIFYDIQSLNKIFSRPLKECVCWQGANESTDTVRVQEDKNIISAQENEAQIIQMFPSSFAVKALLKWQLHMVSYKISMSISKAEGAVGICICGGNLVNYS